MEEQSKVTNGKSVSGKGIVETIRDEFRNNPALRQAKRVVVLIVGGTVVLLGVALIFLPGPAFIVIPAGLGILAVEFEWARRWLRRARALLQRKVEGR